MPALRWVGIAAFATLASGCGKIGLERHDEHGMTALMRAADRGDSVEAARLIRRWADVNGKVPTRDLREFIAFISWMQQLPQSDIGYTPLMFAARGGHSGVVRLLLSHDADVAQRARGGTTALLLATSRSNIEVMRLLIAGGARPEPGDLRTAVIGGTPAAVALLLASGADPNARERPSRASTPPMPPIVILAAQRGDTAILRLLLAAKADASARDRNGWSAIRWLREGRRGRAATDTAAIIAMLEAAGGRDVAGDRDRALFDAIGTRDAAAARAALDSGANPNALDDRGVPPLVLAAQHGVDEIVGALLEAGARVNANPSNGTTPLNAAIMNGNVEVVTRLLAAGADVDQADYVRQTPLQVAAGWKRAEVTQMLLSRAKPDYRSLATAALNADSAQVAMILARGADVNGGNGTVLSEAVRGCLRRSDGVVVGMLLAAGANARFVSEYGDSPLHRAAGLCDVSVVRMLLARGANPNQEDGNSFTPLISAAAAGKLDNVRALIAAGANVNARDGDGKSVLAYAARHPAIVAELKRAGAR